MTIEKFSKFPTTKAKNAYELLNSIIRLVRNDPKRMRMQDWGRKGNAGWVPHDQQPACGTVGCIGGWIGMLTKQDSLVKVVKILGFDIIDDFNDNRYIDELFFGKLVGDHNQGTPAHAEKVIKSIKLFQKTHAARLKAHAITV